MPAFFAEGGVCAMGEVSGGKRDAGEARGVQEAEQGSSQQGESAGNRGRCVAGKQLGRREAVRGRLDRRVGEWHLTPEQRRRARRN